MDRHPAAIRYRRRWSRRRGGVGDERRDTAIADRLAELSRAGVRNDLARRVEQIAVAIALEHRAEQPAVAMKVGKLRVRQRRIEWCAAGGGEKLWIGPQAAQRGAFRI